MKRRRPTRLLDHDIRTIGETTKVFLFELRGCDGVKSHKQFYWHAKAIFLRGAVEQLDDRGLISRYSFGRPRVGNDFSSQVQTMNRKKSLPIHKMRVIAVQIKLRHTHDIDFVTGKAVEFTRLANHSLIPYGHAVGDHGERPFTDKVIPTFYYTEDRNATPFGLFDDV